MKATTILALIAPLATVHASCYRSGDYWGNELDATNKAIDKFCDSQISGSFSSGQTKYACESLQANKKAELYVKYNGQGTGSVSREECIYRLKNEAGGCYYGGQSDVGSWHFRSDPNGGQC